MAVEVIVGLMKGRKEILNAIMPANWAQCMY